ncbi:MAG TPA: hypothetical protein DCM67_13730 [Propionibacteriaceae bacterium]|nr:hypothetical protein [Propionibacteriaceae bacterium]
MTPSALILMVISILILWGGLIAAIVALRLRPEVDAYPPGGEGTEHTGVIIEHDT